MNEIINADLSILTIGVLLVLSIVTIYYLKYDRFKITSQTDYLFYGHYLLYNLSSNLGTIFSATYFFGATIIYSAIYGYWLFIVGFVSFLISCLFYYKIIDIIEIHRDKIPNLKTNVLLSLLKIKTTEKEFQKIVSIFIIIYFGLLIEEFAVSRLVISTIFPTSPFVSTFILFGIIFIIFIYLYYGGFRAVINSDFIQSIVLITFLLMLIFLTLQNSGSEQFNALTIPQTDSTTVLALVMWSVFAVSWQLGLIDFYSRLNIVTSGNLLKNSRKNLILISLILLLFILSVGILFGSSISGLIQNVEDPKDYTNTVIKFFLFSNSIIIKVIFLISLFSMIFTTIDTLLITLLQVGSFHSKIKFINRKNLSPIILLASIFSMLLSLNSVCAFGIYMGSLMIIIFFILIQTIFYPKTKIFPTKLYYGYLALFYSAVFFIYFYDNYETKFANQYYIPLIVIISVIMAMITDKIYFNLKRVFL